MLNLIAEFKCSYSLKIICLNVFSFLSSDLDVPLTRKAVCLSLQQNEQENMKTETNQNKTWKPDHSISKTKYNWKTKLDQVHMSP